VTQDLSAYIFDSELALEIESRASTLSLGQGEILFRQGEMPAGVYLVRSGEVMLTRRPTSGGVVLVQLKVGSGCLLALPEAVGSEPCNLSAEAGAGAELGFVPREDFLQMMRAEPRLSLKVMEVLAADLRYSRYALRAFA
jgi:CRP-like cAMP-binding protein